MKKPQAQVFSQKIGISNYNFGTMNEIYDKDKEMQVFACPTYDRIAKHILCSDESVRIDILKCFTGINSIVTATQLDSNYNPFDTFSDLRAIVHSSSV